MLLQYSQLLLSLAVIGVSSQEVIRSIVPGLTFRLTSPDLFEGPDSDCRDDSARNRFTAGIEVKANFTEACYNIDDVFAWRYPNQTTSGRLDRSCHWDSDSCPNEWRYLDHHNFNPNATHSIITTILSGDRMSEWLDGPAQVFRTFEREDCDEGGDWHQWMGCEDVYDVCRELPYGIRSFHVSHQSEENRTDECVVASERGELESGSGGLDASMLISLAVAAGVVAFVQ